MPNKKSGNGRNDLLQAQDLTYSVPSKRTGFWRQTNPWVAPTMVARLPSPLGLIVTHIPR